MLKSETAQNRIRFTVFALFFAAVLSFLDRQLLNILIEPIRSEVGIDDVQISLLQGAAFGLVYAALTFPLAFVADRYSRKIVIIGSVTVWSAMALLFGLGDSFIILLLARMGLAAGEAGLTPAAISIVRQTHSAERQSFIVGLLSCSVYVGGGLAMAVGGPGLMWFESNADILPAGLSPWRMLFVICAILGVVGIIFLAAMPEPRRTLKPRNETSLREFFRLVWVQRSAVGTYLTAFISIHALVVAVMSWTPTIFIRTYGWSPEQTGLAYGIVYFIGGVTGALGSGKLAGWLTSHGNDKAVVTVALIAATLLGFSSIIFALSPNGTTALIFSGFAIIGVGALLVMGSYGLQAMLPPEFSARSVALYFLVPGTLGASFGPSAVPLLQRSLASQDMGEAFAIFAALTSIWSVVCLITLIRMRNPLTVTERAILSSS